MDNASVCNKTVRRMAELNESFEGMVMRLRCWAHIVNLSAKVTCPSHFHFHSLTFFVCFQAFIALFFKTPPKPAIIKATTGKRKRDATPPAAPLLQSNVQQEAARPVQHPISLPLSHPNHQLTTLTRRTQSLPLQMKSESSSRLPRESLLILGEWRMILMLLWRVYQHQPLNTHLALPIEQPHSRLLTSRPRS